MSEDKTEEEQVFQALSKLRLYCARQERCRWDVEQKLREYELPDEYWEEIIDYLLEEDYLNEERYARAYTRGKFRMNAWGRYKIRRGLMEKRIPQDQIELALEEIDGEAYRDTLEKLIRDKLKRLQRKKDDAWKRRQKLIAYCARKGYEIELVNDLLEETDSED